MSVYIRVWAVYLLLVHCVHKVCSAACLLLERVSFRVQFPAVPQWRRSRACYLKFTSRISGLSSLLLSLSLSLFLVCCCLKSLTDCSSYSEAGITQAKHPENQFNANCCRLSRKTRARKTRLIFGADFPCCVLCFVCCCSIYA